MYYYCYYCITILLYITLSNKQILHGLSLNTKFIPLRLNIISSRVNKFDIQQKAMQFLPYYILLFKKNIQKLKKCQLSSNIKFLYFHN